MRYVGLSLRTLFLLLVIVVTGRVASPQSEKLLAAYDTPSDLFRTAIGVAACIFLFVQIFRYSRDPADMRNWVVVGVAAVPLTILCAVIIW